MKQHFSKIFSLLLLWGSCLTAFAQTGTITLQTDSETEIMLDGQLGSEWIDAVKQDLVGGGVLLLKQDPEYLYIAIQGMDEGWGHVYVHKSDTVFVLHASAALGTAVYLKGKSDEWNISKTFSWEVRGTATDIEANAIREEYLNRNRWVATTNQMGDKNVLEYKIDKLLFENGYQRLAFVYASDADKPFYWPALLEDATINPDLIFGNTPEVLGFNPSSWALVRFE